VQLTGDELRQSWADISAFAQSVASACAAPSLDQPPAK
jgi:hypothetical protein